MSRRLSGMESGRPHGVVVDLARRFDRVLLELSMSDAVTSGDLDAALHEICTAASRALDVSRTNVWLLDATHGHLREAVSFASSDDGGLSPATLTEEDNPPYFAALRQQRIIAAADARTDPRTERFAAIYLRSRGITSTLDAAIRLHGRLLGAICHEHVGPPRAWDAEEERFAASLGDLVALAIVADERAKAQRAVRASEARYRLLVDGARDLIFNLDARGVVTWVNPAFERLLGQAAGDWLGQHFAGLVAPEDLSLGLEVFQRALSGREVPNFELRLRHASGQTPWFEFTVSVERDGQTVRNVFGVGREITARKNLETRRRVLVAIGQALARCGDDVEQALRTVHEQIAEALDCTHVATALRDPASGALTHVVRHAARAGDEVCDFPPLALVERTIARDQTGIVHDDGAATVAAIACPLHAPEGVLGALVVRRADGGFDAEQIDLLERVSRELVLAIAAARRRREAEENAEVSAALARVGQALIASVDLPRLLERLCRVTTEVLDCDVSYTFLRDETLGAFVHAASYGDPPQVTEALRTLPILDEHTGGFAAALERDRLVLSRAGDGVIAPALWDAYGTRSSLVIALLHGTCLVGAQAASYRSDDGAFDARHVRIAQGIAQLASLAIANARLVGELEAAGRIKSDFVATMSHELRTPLNVILGYTDMLLLEEFGALDAAQADTLRRVRASTTELQELIEATLDLSRLESGSVALRIEEVDLRGWIAEVEAETSPLRERKPQLDVRWSVAAGAGRLRCDALKLKVILKNLIGNALKFTHEGFVEVHVEARPGALAMTVADSGIGMSPDVRAVIFEAFRQGDASLTRPYGGVGLGLYIVRRLVDALHGRVEVESEPGVGSTFHVVIPLQAPRAAPPGR